jgi:hypothetical protein
MRHLVSFAHPYDETQVQFPLRGDRLLPLADSEFFPARMFTNFIPVEIPVSQQWHRSNRLTLAGCTNDSEALCTILQSSFPACSRSTMKPFLQLISRAFHGNVRRSSQLPPTHKLPHPLLQRGMPLHIRSRFRSLPTQVWRT